MWKLEDIERAVATLAPDESERFRARYATFESAQFDDMIAADANAGRLDALADEALRELAVGHTRSL